MGEDIPDWQEVLPGGPLIRGKDGRNYMLSDPQGLVDALNAKTANERQADVALDVEHAMERKPQRGEEAPAQGWYKQFRLNTDGYIEGRLEPNDNGAWKIASKDWRYLSPVILYDPDTLEIVDIESVSLTNNPNFNLRAINDALDPSTVEDKPMLEKMRKLLGLDASATDTDVTGSVEKALHDSKILAGLAKDLKIEGEPTIEALQKALHDRQQPAGKDTPALEDFVPRADYEALRKEVGTLKKSMHDQQLDDRKTRVDALIARALHDRKIAPQSEAYHRASMGTPEGIAAFEKFIGDAPELLPDQMKKAEHDAQGGLSSSEQEVCNLLGVDPEQFKANRI